MDGSTEGLVEVPIPLDANTARMLEDQGRREAIGRYLSGLFTGGRLPDVLAHAIADLKREAHANGLTDEIVEAELEAWRAERSR